jgi:hypothetical protein
MVLSIGQRILPAFAGMRLLWSTKLMFAALLLVSVGCTLRVFSEVLAYQGYAAWAWSVLPGSAVFELAGLASFAVNILGTSPRPFERQHLFPARGRQLENTHLARGNQEQTRAGISFPEQQFAPLEAPPARSRRQGLDFRLRKTREERRLAQHRLNVIDHPCEPARVPEVLPIVEEKTVTRAKGIENLRSDGRTVNGNHPLVSRNLLGLPPA